MYRKTKKPAAGGGAAGFSKDWNNGWEEECRCSVRRPWEEEWVPEIRSFAGGGALLRWPEDTGSCPDRQRPNRSAAMRLLQCNINPVLIFRPLRWRRSFLCAGLEIENEFDQFAEEHFALLQYRPRTDRRGWSWYPFRYASRHKVRSVCHPL